MQCMGYFAEGQQTKGTLKFETYKYKCNQYVTPQKTWIQVTWKYMKCFLQKSYSLNKYIFYVYES